GHRDQQGRHEGDRHGHREGPEQLPGDPGDDGDRQEDGHRGEGRGRHRARHLLDRGDDGGRGQRDPGHHPALDVLGDHDGVVDHPADGHGQGRQGEDVERV
ncbi:MAG: hypothetical protein AVDCRST_MAG48-533, partial [uncultured Friedmanniella sp.]